MSTDKKTITSFYMKRSLRNKIKAEAASRDMSMGELIENAFDELYSRGINDTSRIDWLGGPLCTLSVSVPEEVSHLPLRKAIDELMGVN